jgi:hypothetical protein
MTIAYASQVRFPCESPVPSRPVPSPSIYPSIVTTGGFAHPAAAVAGPSAMDEL